MNTSESGYEINLSLFQQMLNEIIAQGANYNPPVANLSLENLQLLVDPVKTVLANVTEGLTTYTLAVNSRQEAYELMKTRVKKIKGFLELFNLDDRIMADIKSVYDKIMGYSTNSVQGYDHLEENFKAFVSFLENLEAYQVNDAELTIESLEVLADELENKTLTVSSASATLAASRNERDQLMYESSTGIVSLARKVKHYYKAVQGSKGIMYKRLVSLLAPMR